MTQATEKAATTRYVRRREIARGGTGVILEAEHVVTGRKVALKELLPPHDQDPQHRARLLREARALTLARHPSIVDVLDAGVDDAGRPFLALEMLEGRPLDAVLTTRRVLPVDQVVALGTRLCDALTAVHGVGVLHRDIKPGNLFLVPDGEGHEHLKVVDFGIARVPGEDADGSVAPAPKLTAHNAILGTPDYMAPEQMFDHAQVDERADVFAAAVCLYECLTGEVPYPSTYPQVLGRPLAKPPLANARRAEVPVPLAAAVASGMTPDLRRRPPTASAFRDALTAAWGDGAVPALALLGGDAASRGLEADRPTQQGPAPERVHPRAPYVTPVRIRRADGTTLDGRSVDISEGGLLVMTDSTSLDCGEDAAVKFSPPELAVVEVPVKTRWVRDGRGRRAVGLAFLALPEGARQAIARYVDVVQRLEA